MPTVQFHGQNLQAAIDAARAAGGIVIRSIGPEVKDFREASPDDWGYWNDSKDCLVRPWESCVWPKPLPDES